MNKSLKNSPTPQETIPPHRMIWESYMKLRSNRGYIQGELNLVDGHDWFDIPDKHEYFDIPDKLDQLDTEIVMISLTPR